MAEIINLKNPHKADPREATFFEIQEVNFDWKNNSIRIIIGDGVLVRMFFYTTQAAQNILISLNKSDLSQVSLQRMLLEQLIADGYLDGNITGKPN